LASGAMAFVAKPIQSKDYLDGLFAVLDDFIARSTKSLLVVEPDAERRQRILTGIDSDDVQVTSVPDAERALEMLAERRIDCVVLDATDVADVETFTEGIAASINGKAECALSRLPVILFAESRASREMTGREAEVARRLKNVSTVREAHSFDRLLDLTAFFLHRNVAKLPEAKRQVLLDLHQSDKILDGKKVLIVDDDMRNIFALSTVLEEHDMVIVSADNGRDAIEILTNEPDIDIVLMDIMMPEMDGMETMREIRKVPRLKNLPIVAVTAKAMKGDREKCIDAGAWDYLSKPVDIDQMLAVLRAWLHR
jgi:CheY-like chemotaxis protein